MMIKSIFAIIIITFQPISTDSTTTQLPKMGQWEFLKLINDQRRRVANELPIGNMHELTWEPLLMGSVQIYADAMKVFHIHSFQHAVNRTTELATFIINGNDNAKRQMRNNYESQLLVPLHTMIGCNGFFNKNNRLFLGCVLEPPFPLHQIFAQIRQTPGSMCSPGFQNDDGLCVRIPPPEEEEEEDTEISTAPTTMRPTTEKNTTTEATPTFPSTSKSTVTPSKPTTRKVTLSTKAVKTTVSPTPKSMPSKPVPTPSPAPEFDSTTSEIPEDVTSETPKVYDPHKRIMEEHGIHHHDDDDDHIIHLHENELNYGNFLNFKEVFVMVFMVFLMF